MNRKYAKKKFGQNFLHDESVIKRIVSSIDLNGKNVIEIGPGKGALTKQIVKYAKQLVAFEIDFNLFNFLNEQIKDKNLILINEDFLKSDLTNYVRYSIMANIPYNITSQILFKIFENYKNFDNVILMVQKEVAERICASPGATNYGKLSVTVANFASVQKLFDISSKSFFPQPKVTSSVIYLKLKQNTNISNNKEFLLFIKKCFAMRRKTLINNLKTQINYDYNLVKRFYKLNNLSDNIRPQMLSLLQYQELFLIFNKSQN